MGVRWCVYLPSLDFHMACSSEAEADFWMDYFSDSDSTLMLGRPYDPVKMHWPFDEFTHAREVRENSDAITGHSDQR